MRIDPHNGNGKVYSKITKFPSPREGLEADQVSTMPPMRSEGGTLSPERGPLRAHRMADSRQDGHSQSGRRRAGY